MTNDVKPSDVLDVALNKYLGTKEQWCTGDYAQTKEGGMASPGSEWAQSHCAMGAIDAALSFLGADSSMEERVADEVYRVLAEQNPEFPLMRGFRFSSSRIITFNDGYVSGITGEDLPSVGYDGIRSAFEKARVNLQERGE